jgi:hypothetical protein
MKRITRIGVVALVIVFCNAGWVEADEKLLGNTARGAAKGALIGERGCQRCLDWCHCRRRRKGGCRRCRRQRPLRRHAPPSEINKNFKKREKDNER